MIVFLNFFLQQANFLSYELDVLLNIADKWPRVSSHHIENQLIDSLKKDHV